VLFHYSKKNQPPLHIKKHYNKDIIE